LVLAVCQVALLATLPYLIGRLAEDLDGRSLSKATLWLVLIGLQFVVAPLVTAVASVNATGIAWRFRRWFTAGLVSDALSGTSAAKLEDAAYASSYRGLHESTQEWDFGAGLLLVWQILSGKVAGLVFLVLIFVRYPLVAVGLLVGYLVLGGLYSQWVERQHSGALSAHAEDVNRVGYFRRVLIGPDGGSDLRVFGVQRWFLDRYKETFTQAMTAIWRARGRGARGVLAGVVFCMAVSCVGLFQLTSDLVDGDLALSTALLLAQAFLGVAALGPMGEPETAVGRVAAATHELARLSQSHSSPVRPTSSTAGADFGVSELAVDVRDIRFGYPSAEREIFDGLDLALSKDRVYALVGRNGAGKSTLVKLLAGLLPVTAGSIEVGGQDVATGSPEIGLILQDFGRYPLSLHDNIGLGASDPAVADLTPELLELSGVAELIASGSATQQTILSPSYEGGTDLSGGEWQRVALARALASGRGSGVVILDEPAAALDIGAETQLFEYLRRLGEGWTVLFVSHRLSSVRTADEIIVVDRDDLGVSRVVERGTHDELMRDHGLYAEMFEAQAAMFGGVR
jgi:ATP-binding cassette subfamily B protein